MTDCMSFKLDDEIMAISSASHGRLLAGRIVDVERSYYVVVEFGSGDRSHVHYDSAMPYNK